MIASTSSGRLFAGLGRYLARGRRGGEAHRVAWAEALHLPTRDPEIAARYMQASAHANTRVEKPVYHVALAFHPDDPVTPAMMRQAAHRLLRDLGLEGHQAVIVAHQDRDHPHVHLMVNRVHPDTGRVWDRSFDFRRIEASLRAQERELGVRIVPGKHAALPAIEAAAEPTRAGPRARPPELDDADRHSAAGDGIGAPGGMRTKGEVRQAMRTAEVALIERARAQVRDFRESPTWDALTDRLAAAGLRVERKGQGLVVTDGVTAVKASRVARDCALAQLESRLGVRYDRWLAERAHAAARPDTGLATREHQREQGRDAGPEGMPERTRERTRDRTANRTQEPASPRRPVDDSRRGATGPDVGPTSEQPAGRGERAQALPARAASSPSRAEVDPMASTVVPTTDAPDTPGGPPRRRFEAEELNSLTRALRYAERTLDDPQRVNPELARPVAEQGASARFVARRLEQYEQVLQTSISATTAREAYVQARDAAENAITAGRSAETAEARFRGALAAVYRDPAAARQEFDKATAQVGLDKAAEMLRTAPELYGKLNAVEVQERKLFTTTVREDDRAARTQAPLASDLAERAAAARAAAPTAEQVGRFVDAMNRAEASAVRAEAALAQLPRADELARSVARGVARLDERAFGELKAALPVARAELADTFRDATVQVLARESAGRLQQVREQLAERTGVALPGGGAPSPEQRAQAAALHGETTRALLEGRDIARALGPAGAGGAGGAPDVGRAGGGPAGVGTGDGVGKGAERSDRAAVEGRASPRERAEAADKSGRLVHQAVQALTPEELQALTTAVRVGAQLAVSAAVNAANLVAKDVAVVQQAVRVGVAKALAAREVER